MTDIDRFKIINDKHGHSVGDAALVHFANLLKDARRADDILARVGGEEFALVLSGTGLEDALKIADSLCAKVESAAVTVAGSEMNMTASFGVATTVSIKDKQLSDTIVRG